MKNRLTIAIQKGGRLSDQSKDLIKKSGINFSTKGDKLLAKSNNLPIDILFVRDDDIPSLVSNGDALIRCPNRNCPSCKCKGYIDRLTNNAEQTLRWHIGKYWLYVLGKRHPSQSARLHFGASIVAGPHQQQPRN